MSDYRLIPVTLKEAKAFVDLHHRHNLPPLTWKFGVGLANGDASLVGVAMAGLPKARMLMQREPYTLEVNRVCTNGSRNANSMLYGAIARAAKALGYRRLVTYTLAEESGSSLRGAGWTVDAELPARDVGHWSDHPNTSTPQRDLFGNERRPPGAKIRWSKGLADDAG